MTALHNVLGCGASEVRRLVSEAAAWAGAEVLWPEVAPDLEREPQADAALVTITDQGGSRRRAVSLSGGVVTGLKSGGLITAYVDGVAVPGKPSEKSRWAGASGAALFARGRLIGVVTTDRQRDCTGDQSTAVSMASLASCSARICHRVEGGGGATGSDGRHGRRAAPDAI
ncbi:hypothetical protein ACWD3I_08790 [Streptomyces sp. NPDC002817]|uniref:hypothetical protein n=1 Tax=Streptomyces sp. NPDC088357 TaxID=3154655 RepID=UPI00342A6B99